MNYLVLKSCFAGGQRQNAGDVIQLSGDEAGNLIAMGRVEIAPAQKPKAEIVDRAAKVEKTRK